MLLEDAFIPFDYSLSWISEQSPLDLIIIDIVLFTVSIMRRPNMVSVDDVHDNRPTRFPTCPDELSCSAQ